MSQDFRGFLQQMQGCAVSVVTWDHARLLGTLAAVADDCIRMTGVVLQDSHDTGGWSDRLLIEDMLEDRGNQWPEIIIQRNLISTVTMVSDIMRPDPVAPLGREESSDGLDNSKAAQSQELDTIVQHVSGHCETVRLELGSAVLDAFQMANERLLNFRIKDRITATRVDLEKTLGFQLQPFRILSNSSVPSDQFRVLIHGIEVGRGTIIPGKILAIIQERTALPPGGIETIEPVYGLPAAWIEPDQHQQAVDMGSSVVDAMSVIATMLEYHVKRHAKELLTYEAVSAALDELRESHPITLANLIPHPVSLRSLFEVLRGLVGEGVVIRHILPILESVGRHVEHCESMPLLISRVRSDIPLIICGPHLDDSGRLPVFVVEKGVADEVFPDQPGLLTSDSSLLTIFLDEIRKLKKPLDLTRPPILVVPHSKRERIWTHCRSTFEDVVVLTSSEIPSHVRLDVIGTIGPEIFGHLPPQLEESPETMTELWQRKPR